MDKILNITKYNTYGLSSMVSKYVFMERNETNCDIFYIYQIKSILNEIFPTKYECYRGYELIVPKGKKLSSTNKFETLELNNNDTLYEISLDEYLSIFKVFVEYSGTNIKINSNEFKTI